MLRCRPGKAKVVNSFDGTVTKLSPSELRSFGKDVNHEVCAVCGKDIYFTAHMTRSDYTYKRSGKGGTKYYCGWNHYQKGGD
jgi:hypothetical protein